MPSLKITVSSGDDPQKISLQDGKVLNINGSSNAVGIVYRVDPILGGANIAESWSISGGLLSPIGPYVGEQLFVAACSIGSINISYGELADAIEGRNDDSTYGVRLALMGDSLTAFGGFGGSGTATAEGTTVTVQETNHGEVVGGTVVLHLSGNNVAPYHGVWKVASVIDKDNFTVIVREAPSGPAGTIAVIGSRSMSSNSFAEAANFRLDAPFTIVVNAGIGGNTTDQMLARLGSDVTAYAPNYCLLMGGTNDIRYTQTPAARDSAVTNLIAMCQQLLTASITPVLCSILPLRSDDQGFAITTPLILSANASLAAFAARTPGVIFADTFAEMVDNTAADNRALTSCMTDSVHINNVGRFRISSAIANALLRFCPNPQPLISSNADTYAYSSQAGNRLTNPLLIATGGTAGAGVTGTVAANLGITVGGTAAAVASIVPRTVVDDGDRLGNNQRVVVTAPALDDSVSIKTLQTITQFAAGDEVYFDLSHAVRAATNIKFLIFDLAVIIGGQTYHAYVDAGSSGGFPSADAPFQGVKRSMFFKLPGAPISCILTVQCQFGTGGGSATFDIGRLRIAKKV